MDHHFRGGFKTKSHIAAVNSQYGDENVVVDDDAFLLFSAQD
jgi:hypothetical protein